MGEDPAAGPNGGPASDAGLPDATSPLDRPCCGVVCGLVSEARLLMDKPALVRPVAGIQKRATEEVRALAREGASAILSFGLAGGLAKDLRPGALVVATQVVTERERLTCDPRLVAILSGALPLARTGPVAGSDEAVTTARGKSLLAATTDAIAVDMESHAAARAARDVGLPFAVLRAVADPADRAIPPLALAALHPDGTTGAWPVVKGLIRRPWLLPALLRLAGDSKAAHEALARAVAAGAVEAVLVGVKGKATVAVGANGN